MDRDADTTVETKNDVKIEEVATPQTTPSSPLSSSTPSPSSSSSSASSSSSSSSILKSSESSGGKKLYYQQDALTNAAMKIQFDIFVRQSQKLQQTLTKLEGNRLKQKLITSVLSAETKEGESEGLLNRRILPEEYTSVHRKLGQYSFANVCMYVCMYVHLFV